MKNPIIKEELFRIVEGDTVYALTSASQFLTLNEEVYTPATISRSQINIRAEVEKRTMDLTVPANTPLGERYRNTIVESHVTITVYEREDGITLILFRGRLVSSKVDGGQLKLRFENGMGKLNRNGATRRYSETCPYAVYSEECGASKILHTKSYEVLEVQSNKLKIKSDEPIEANFYKGGVVNSLNDIRRPILGNYDSVRVDTEILDEVTEEVVEVVTHYETEILLYIEFYSDDVKIGDVIAFSEGCDKSIETCAERFENEINFGGFPYFPSNNPFNGTIV